MFHNIEFIFLQEHWTSLINVLTTCQAYTAYRKEKITKKMNAMNKIQKLQNRAALIVSNEYNWNISSSELIEQLKWMNIKTRRDYFISLIMFKTVNGFGLNYLLNELTVTQDYHNYYTRASSNNLIVLPRPHSELFKTSMKYYACDLWNSLPGHIKSAENIQTFKSMYKRYINTQNE